jgi:integrase
MALDEQLYHKTINYLNKRKLSEKTRELYGDVLAKLFQKEYLTQTLYNEYYYRGQRYRAVLKLVIAAAEHYDIPIYKYKEIPFVPDKPKKHQVFSEKQIQRMVREIEDYGLLIECAYHIGGGLRFSTAIMLKWTSFNWEEWLENRSLAGKCDVFAKGNNDDSLDVDPYLMNKLYSIAKRNNKLFQGIPYRNFRGEHYMFFEEQDLNKLIKHYQDIAFNNNLDQKEDIIKVETTIRARNDLIAKLHKRVDYRLRKLKDSFDGKKIRFHSIRHSRATHLLRKGFDITEIQEMLMHKNILTTQIYVEADREQITNKVNKLLGTSDSSHSL